MKRKTNQFPLLCISVAILFVVNGCASLSKDQCLEANWKSLGLSDGKMGYKNDRVEKHNSACKEFNISVNEGEYAKGWWQGINKYCVPSNGYLLGERIEPYNDVCSGYLESGFLTGYVEGLETASRNVSWAYRQEKDEYSLYYRKIDHVTDEKQREALKKKIDEHKKKVEILEEKIKQIQQFQSEARVRQLSSGL